MLYHVIAHTTYASIFFQDLLAINKMLSRQGEPKMNAVKRIDVGDESGPSPSKRHCPDQNPAILKRYGEMMVDRKASGNM